MKKYLKRGFIALLVVLAYVIGCLVFPPAFQRRAEEADITPGASGERVACIDDNVEALVWRIRMIEAAKEEVILSTFGFGTGAAGKDMLCALLNAAERGVEIRLLLDGYNGAGAVKDNEDFEALASLPNVTVKLYNELNLLTPWTANYRMHDKFVIVDDSMYLLGGRNTNDLFLGDYSAEPNIDRDILVCGSGGNGSLRALRDYFEALWALPESREFTYKQRDTEGFRKTLRSRYESLKKNYPQAFGFSDWEGQTLEADSVALLAGDIQAGNKAPTLWKSLCAYMAQGKQVLIQTPYVICNGEMYKDLTALTDGGTAVTILTNSTETGANPFGCTDYANEKDEILETGTGVLEFAGEHSLHAKTVLVDDRISIVGSFNMDMRSAYIDTETMLVIDCPALNAQLRAQMDQMARQSLHVAPDGTETPGEDYVEGQLGFWKGLGYGLLRIFGGLIRHLM